MDQSDVTRGSFLDEENHFFQFKAITNVSKRKCTNCPSSASKRQALVPMTNFMTTGNISSPLQKQGELMEKSEVCKHAKGMNSQAAFQDNKENFYITESHLTVPIPPSCGPTFSSFASESIPQTTISSCGLLTSTFNCDSSLTTMCSIGGIASSTSSSVSTSIHCLPSLTSPSSQDSPMLVSSPDNCQSLVSDAEVLSMFDTDVQHDFDDDTPTGVYAKEIFHNLRNSEAIRHPNAVYMRKQQDITCGMRAILVDWLVEVTDEFQLEPQTLFLSVAYVDFYLSHISVARSRLQLVGTTCMYLAAKVEEIYPPEIGQFAYITDNTYSKKEIVNMEKQVLKTLDFQLLVPTIYTFLLLFLKASSVDSPQDSNVCLHVDATSKYLCELALLDSEPFLKYLPSTVAASAVCLARHTIGIAAWPSVMVCYTSYSVADISHCVQDMHRSLAMAHSHPQQAIRHKYNTQKYSMVSSWLKAPETLPY